MVNADSPSSSDENGANLTVVVRIRPLTDEEKNRGASQVAYQIDDRMVILLDPDDDLNDVLRQNRSREKKYLFDRSFGPDSTQEEVYEATTKTLINSVTTGYNATVFAYGATGAGKTHTMLGNDENPGIMARALDELFRKMESNSDNMLFDVKMSYLEIYNECIRDLLNPSSGVLDLREDNRGNIQVAGLSEVQTRSSAEVLRLLITGNLRRTQEPTAANKTSSRSHAVLQVTVIQRDRLRDVKDQHRIGKLFLIDLAGSERASQTQNTGQRMKEGAAINRSLLALGNVINTLTEKGAKYVNYRDSKLTRLLKDSLGGNSRTVMIAAISPASIHFEESRNTLLYADRAKHIKTKLEKNTADVKQHVTQYQSIISELRKEISRLQTKVEDQSRSNSANSTMRQTTTVSKAPKQNESQRKEFNTLKSQLMTLFEEQMKLRRQLLDANDLAYDLTGQIGKRQTILQAYEEKQLDYGGENKPETKITSDGIQVIIDGDEPEKIRILRDEYVSLEAHLKDVEAKKSTLEWELAINRQNSQKLEDSLPKQITSEDQREILSLLLRGHESELDKIVLQSDGALTTRKLVQHETALQTMEQYTTVADKLITEQHALLGAVNADYPPKLSNLFNSYQVLKTQAQMELFPPDNKLSELSQKSWNRDILEKERKLRDSRIFSKTLNHAELAQMKAEMEKPSRTHDDSDQSLRQNRLPKIESIRSPPSDDSSVSYQSQKPRSSQLPDIPSSHRRNGGGGGGQQKPNPPVATTKTVGLRRSSRSDPSLSIIAKRTRKKRETISRLGNRSLSRTSLAAANQRPSSPPRGARRSRSKIPAVNVRRARSSSHPSVTRNNLKVDTSEPHRRNSLAQQKAVRPVRVTKSREPSDLTRIPQPTYNRRVTSPSRPKLPYIEYPDGNNFVSRKK